MEKGTMFKPELEVSYQNETIVSKRIVENNAGGITIFAFDKGQRLSEHTAPFDATIQVLDGVGEIMINSKPHRLEKGQMIVMPANIPHAVNAIEQFKMMLIMVRGN